MLAVKSPLQSICLEQRHKPQGRLLINANIMIAQWRIKLFILGQAAHPGNNQRGFCCPTAHTGGQRPLVWAVGTERGFWFPRVALRLPVANCFDPFRIILNLLLKPSPVAETATSP